MKLELLDDIKEGLPQGFSPYKIYSIRVEENEVGRLIVREGTDEERYYDGHIGYHIDEEYRGHHYGYEACLLLKEILNMDHVMITCDPSNYASIWIIERLGCHYLETKPIPKHLRKYFAKDEKEKRIYRWELKE